MSVFKLNLVLFGCLLQFFGFKFLGWYGFGLGAFLLFVFVSARLKFLVILFLILIGARLWMFDYFEPNHLKWLNDTNQVIELTGRICLEPDLRRDDVRYFVCPDEYAGRFLVKASLYPRFEYGDKIRVAGRLETPFEEKEFSYKNYLRIFKTDSLLQPVSGLDLLEEGGGFLNGLFGFKNWFLHILEYQLMEPASSLVAGLVLGVRKGFSDTVMEQFNVTGLTHIIAVSGYNVSMIIVIVNSLLGFVPRQIRFYLITVFLFMFMLITGASASVVRAVIMGVIALAALESGRQQFFARTIVLTALIMGLWNPAFVMYDAGMHLSFLSTLGVVYLAPLLDFKWLPESGGIREAFVLTIAAQLATMPILLFQFGRISLVSPFANLAVAPFLPLCMLFGFMAFIFAWNGLVSWIFISLTSICSWFLFKFVEFFAVVPYAAIDFEKGLWWPLVVYLICFGWFVKFRLKNIERLT